MIKKKSYFIAFFACLLLSANVSADVLGTENYDETTNMGAYTYLHKVQFTSDSATVGKQTEYFVEYTPNDEAVPVVVNGESIYGSRNIKQAYEYMKSNGMRPLIGINADYFSFKTGIPMGHTIIDGELASKEDAGQDAVGFRADGTGYIGWLDITTTMSNGENEIDILYINKWCQPGFDPVYLINDRFGKTTKTSSECIFVIMSPKEGRLSIGETMTAVVEESFIYDGDITIPEGKMIALMDTSGTSAYLEFLKSLEIGQEITVRNEADRVWNDIEHGMGSVGGRLINNGVLGTNFEAGAAPRTAVGIKENGDILFYVLDGRQPGYSYGSQLTTLAKRMAELGCVEALNLDGGGSTSIAGVYPGSDEFSVINSPSDGSLRNVANFIFLQDNRLPTDVAGYIHLEPIENNHYLSGASAKINITSVYDTHNYKMEFVPEIKYQITGTESTAEQDGSVWFNGSGEVVVSMLNAYDDVIKKQIFYTYETPDDIKIFNQSNWSSVEAIYADPNEALELDLAAVAYADGKELNGYDALFHWEIEGDIGTVDENGYFVLTDAVDRTGKIKISAGEFTKEIDVVIHDHPAQPGPFADTNGHWAEKILTDMANLGVINGVEEGGMLLFKPDENMTRAEFAFMINNYLNVDLSEYEHTELIFRDKNEIPKWAENAIKAMYEMEVIQGRENDDASIDFAPYDRITRAEAMTILGRIVDDNTPVAILDFADFHEVPDWAAESMGKLLTLNVIQGYEDNTILPSNNIKRAESAAMLYKLYN